MHSLPCYKHPPLERCNFYNPRACAWYIIITQSPEFTLQSLLHILCCSVCQSCPTLWPHGLQHARFPCPLTPLRAFSNSGPLSQWCHPTISSSVIPFSSCRQSFPASQSFLVSQLFESGGQNTGASASVSVLPMNIQDRFPLGLTDFISL